MKCPNCFNPLRPGQTFCGVCGSQIPQANSSEASTEAEPVCIPAVAEPWEQDPLQAEPTKPWEREALQDEPTRLWERDSAPPEKAKPWQQTETVTQAAEPWQQTETVTQAAEPWQQTETVTQAAEPWQQTETVTQAAEPWNRQKEQWQPPRPAQRPAPPSNYNDSFAQQYRDFQQRPQDAGTRKGDGSLPPQKINTALMVTVVVLAVLLIAGGIIMTIMLFNNGNRQKDEASAAESSIHGVVPTVPTFVNPLGSDPDETGTDSPSTTVPESVAPPQTTAPLPTEAPTEAPQPSVIDDSSHVVVMGDVTLAKDDAINVSDKDAEDKLDSCIFANPDLFEVHTSGFSFEGVDTQGNAAVYYFVAEDDELSADAKEALKKTLEASARSTIDAQLTALRNGSGVSNAVAVYAYLDEDDNLIYSTLAK